MVLVILRGNECATVTQGGLIKKGAAEIAERDQDHVPEAGRGLTPGRRGCRPISTFAKGQGADYLGHVCRAGHCGDYDRRNSAEGTGARTQPTTKSLFVACMRSRVGISCPGVEARVLPRAEILTCWQFTHV